MKAKLRRLEEDNAKREKQIEALLDPTKVRSEKSFFFCQKFLNVKHTNKPKNVFSCRDLNIRVVWWIGKETGVW